MQGGGRAFSRGMAPQKKLESTLKSTVGGFDTGLVVKWGAFEVKGLDPKRAEAIGLKPAVRKIGYGSSSSELPPMLQCPGTIARYCRRTAELMLQSSGRWKQIEVNTRETNEHYNELLTLSRVQEEAYRTAADILAKIMERPSLLNVWELSCPGLLRSKTRELELQEEGTAVYLETLKEKTRIELVYDAVVALRKVEEERPIRAEDIALHHAGVAARAGKEQNRIMDQEAALAKELGEIGDGSETILAYEVCGRTADARPSPERAPASLASRPAPRAASRADILSHPLPHTPAPSPHRRTSALTPGWRRRLCSRTRSPRSCSTCATSSCSPLQLRSSSSSTSRRSTSRTTRSACCPPRSATSRTSRSSTSSTTASRRCPTSCTSSRSRSRCSASRTTRSRTS